jgi:hypothetical protein
MTKTYIAFDADSDINYYNTLKMWKNHKDIDFDFDNAHELNTIRQHSSEETIKRKLRERINQANIFILLVGEKTKYLYKYVRWEIELAIELALPIIVCNINDQRTKDPDLCPAILDDKLTVHIPFRAKIINHAHKNWPLSHRTFKDQNKIDYYHYTDETYEKLGLNETEKEKMQRRIASLQALDGFLGKRF